MGDAPSSLGSGEVRVLMFTDLEGSVDLKQRLGGGPYLELLSAHDAVFRRLIEGVRGADIVTDTGDGFFATFRAASDGVAAALRFVAALAMDTPALRVRIGLHMGEVTPLASGKLVGLATDVASRVMGLAGGGQVLMSRTVFDDARQHVRSNPAGDSELTWLAHGAYRFKGVDEPLEIFEVGSRGAPLAPPKDSDKGKRIITQEDEDVLGWRPAVGLKVPRRELWRLQEKLGEGGFGEVWLAEHAQTREQRVFKFCFDAERLRSFKRELSLFRLLREALGDRPDIAKLYDVDLARPPFMLESEFTREGNLRDWADRQGGVGQVPLETRLDLLARVADAVAAAHSVGVLHKDLKPSNVLVYMDESGHPRPRLADFGIGALTDRSRLDTNSTVGVTIAGFTESTLTDVHSSRTGTRMYAPPELLAGKPFTIQGDVYALGVMLYQSVVGDFERPLAPGWERDVQDELLQADIAACVEGDAARRVESAQHVSIQLRQMSYRRRSLRRRRIRRLATVTCLAAVVIGSLATGLFQYRRALMWRVLRAEDQRVYANRLAGVAFDMVVQQKHREQNDGNQFYGMTPEAIRVQFEPGVRRALALHAVAYWLDNQWGPPRPVPFADPAVRERCKPLLEEAVDQCDCYGESGAFGCSLVYSDAANLSLILKEYERAADLYQRAAHIYEGHPERDRLRYFVLSEGYLRLVELGQHAHAGPLLKELRRIAERDYLWMDRDQWDNILAWSRREHYD